MGKVINIPYSRVVTHKILVNGTDLSEQLIDPLVQHGNWEDVGTDSGTSGIARTMSFKLKQDELHKWVVPQGSTALDYQTLLVPMRSVKYYMVIDGFEYLTFDGFTGDEAGANEDGTVSVECRDRAKIFQDYFVTQGKIRTYTSLTPTYTEISNEMNSNVTAFLNAISSSFTPQDVVDFVNGGYFNTVKSYMSAQSRADFVSWYNSFKITPPSIGLETNEHLVYVGDVSQNINEGSYANTWYKASGNPDAGEVYLGDEYTFPYTNAQGSPLTSATYELLKKISGESYVNNWKVTAYTTTEIYVHFWAWDAPGVRVESWENFDRYARVDARVYPFLFYDAVFKTEASKKKMYDFLAWLINNNQWNNLVSLADNIVNSITAIISMQGKFTGWLKWQRPNGQTGHEYVYDASQDKYLPALPIERLIKYCIQDCFGDEAAVNFDISNGYSDMQETALSGFFTDPSSTPSDYYEKSLWAIITNEISKAGGSMGYFVRQHYGEVVNREDKSTFYILAPPTSRTDCDYELDYTTDIYTMPVKYSDNNIRNVVRVAYTGDTTAWNYNSILGYNICSSEDTQAQSYLGNELVAKATESINLLGGGEIGKRIMGLSYVGQSTVNTYEKALYFVKRALEDCVDMPVNAVLNMPLFPLEPFDVLKINYPDKSGTVDTWFVTSIQTDSTNTQAQLTRSIKGNAVQWKDISALKPVYQTEYLNNLKKQEDLIGTPLPPVADWSNLTGGNPILDTITTDNNYEMGTSIIERIKLNQEEALISDISLERIQFEAGKTPTDLYNMIAELGGEATGSFVTQAEAIALLQQQNATLEQNIQAVSSEVEQTDGKITEAVTAVTITTDEKISTEKTLREQTESYIMQSVGQEIVPIDGWFDLTGGDARLDNVYTITNGDYPMTRTSSLINQTSEALQLVAYSSEGQAALLEIHSDYINNLVTKTDGHATQIKQTADALLLQATYIDETKNELLSTIEQTAESITLQVSNQLTGYSTIQQTAEAISLQINNGENLVTAINATEEGITLLANKIAISSDNFAVTEEGLLAINQISANSITSGNITLTDEVDITFSTSGWKMVDYYKQPDPLLPFQKGFAIKNMSDLKVFDVTESNFIEAGGTRYISECILGNFKFYYTHMTRGFPPTRTGTWSISVLNASGEYTVINSGTI